MPSIMGVEELYHALRSIIPNIPDKNVERLVIRCGPVDEAPTMDVTMATVGADTTTPVDSGVVSHVPAIVRETRRFKIVPEDAP